jgi:hypothetical protein
MKLTVLSPGEPQLASLRVQWKRVVHDAGLDPKDRNRWRNLLEKAARKGVKSSILGEPSIKKLAQSPFDQDTAEANGSTIALLAEFKGKSVLLAGDAFPTVLLDAVGRLCRARGIRRLKVDAFKLPHHGSAGNVSNELLAALPSSRYIFSTSGAVFGHPDDEAVARVIAAPTKAAVSRRRFDPIELVRTETAVSPSTRGPRAAPPPSSLASSRVAGSRDELANDKPRTHVSAELAKAVGSPRQDQR